MPTDNQVNVSNNSSSINNNHNAASKPSLLTRFKTLPVIAVANDGVLFGKKDKVESSNRIVRGDVRIDDDKYHVGVSLASVNPFKKAIVGDIFGSNRGNDERSILGMMYRSRVEEKLHKKHGDISLKNGDTRDNNTADSSINDMVFEESDSDEDVKNISTMNARQQLALTIRNWSILPANDEYIIEEGAVHALIALAGIEDQDIKKYCASSLYHLSSRPNNCERLLNLGAASGVITISMNTRKFKTAKLCALTLCNLTRHPGGEATIAKDGGILSLVILHGIKGHRLLPLCVQALYNLTVVEHHYKGMERVMKAILNLPQTSFDCTLHLVKALVNCSKYSWMRLRLIEDGALSAISNILPTITTRDNCNEIIGHIAVCIRLLSHSLGCVNELLAKGVMDILYTLMQQSNGEFILTVIKTTHNCLRVNNISNHAFGVAVNIIHDAIMKYDDIVMLQYAAACLCMFTKVNVRENVALAKLVFNAMLKLLTLKDPLIQYFAIVSSGQLFFAKGLNGVEVSVLEELVVRFIEVGPNIKDPMAVQALSLALGKVTQEQLYIEVLGSLNLFEHVLDLLFTQLKGPTVSLLVKECASSAICRIGLLVDLSKARRREIADSLVALLSVDNPISVLMNTVSAIRALGSHGVCFDELLQHNLLSSVAEISIKHATDTDFCRMCCAVMAVFSYDAKAHASMCDKLVIDILFLNADADDCNTREIVSTAICNMSVNRDCRAMLIESGIVGVLSTLSGTTSELVQELCAKCICNLTCSPEMQAVILTENILHSILMISLVRSVGTMSKLLCAKALLNLVSDEHMDTLKVSGVFRVFASLSQLEDPSTQAVCAHGYLLFTENSKRVEDIIQRRGAMQVLYSLVKCASLKTRIIVGLAVCNLLASPNATKAVINSGGLAVLKIVATIESEELREAVARIIVNLTMQSTLTIYLLKEPIVSILIYIIQHCTSEWTFHCTLSAIASLSQIEAFRKPMIDGDIVRVLLGSIIAGHVVTEEHVIKVCRTIALLSFEIDKARGTMHGGCMILVLYSLYKANICNTHVSFMITVVIRNLSEEVSLRKLLLDEDGLKLLIDISKTFSRANTTVMKAIVISFLNLSKDDDLHDHLIQHGVMQQLRMIAAGDYHNHTSKVSKFPFNSTEYSYELTQLDIQLIIKTINNLSSSHTCRLQVVDERIVEIYQTLFDGLTDEAKHEMACSLSKLSSQKECKLPLIEQGAADLLIQLSVSSNSLATQSQCSLALSHLSDITKVNQGVVSSLLLLSLKKEEESESLEEKVPPSTDGRRDNAAASTSSPTSLKTMIATGLKHNNQAHKQQVSMKDKNKKLISKLKGVFLSGCAIPRSTEIAALLGDYNEFVYKVKVLPIILDDGGMAEKLVNKLDLPRIDANRELDDDDNVVRKIIVGCNVVRGSDWPADNDDDGGPGSIGVVWTLADGNYTILWPSGKQIVHKYGYQDSRKEGRFYRDILPIDRNSELHQVSNANENNSKDLTDIVNLEVVIEDEAPAVVELTTPITANNEDVKQDTHSKKVVKGKRHTINEHGQTSVQGKRRSSVTSKSTPNSNDGHSSNLDSSCGNKGESSPQQLPGAAWRKSLNAHSSLASPE